MFGRRSGAFYECEGPKVIYDIVDAWSVMNAMYRKRLKIYTGCGFQTEHEKEEDQTASLFQQGNCMLSLEDA